MTPNAGRFGASSTIRSTVFQDY